MKKSQTFILATIAAGCMLLRAGNSRAQEPYSWTANPLNERIAYNALFESENSLVKKPTLEKFVTFLSFFEGYPKEASEPAEKYMARPFLERLNANFMQNLEEKEIFISSLDAEKINMKQEFPFGAYFADSLGKTLVERSYFAKFVDYLLRKTQQATSVSYSADDFRTRAGLVLDDSIGVYGEFKCGRIVFSVIKDTSEIRAGLDIPAGKKCRIYAEAGKDDFIASAKWRF